MATDSQEYLSLGSSLMQGLGMNYLTIFPEAAQCTDKSMRCQGEGRREERESIGNLKTCLAWGLAADPVSIPGTTYDLLSTARGTRENRTKNRSQTTTRCGPPKQTHKEKGDCKTHTVWFWIPIPLTLGPRARDISSPCFSFLSDLTQEMVTDQPHTTGVRIKWVRLGQCLHST